MNPPTHLSAVRAIRAGLMAGLVLALGLLVHLPTVHAWLHHAEPHAHAHHSHPGTDSAPISAEHEATCAITLFAQGLAGPLPPPELLAPVVLAPPLPPAPTLEILTRESPAYLHPPGQAPPSAA